MQKFQNQTFNIITAEALRLYLTQTDRNNIEGDVGKISKNKAKLEMQTTENLSCLSTSCEPCFTLN